MIFSDVACKPNNSLEGKKKRSKLLKYLKYGGKNVLTVILSVIFNKTFYNILLAISIDSGWKSTCI